MAAPLLIIAAGGTGGHMFPAQALAEVMLKRGWRGKLSTDARGAHHQTGAVQGVQHRKDVLHGGDPYWVRDAGESAIEADSCTTLAGVAQWLTSTCGPFITVYTLETMIDKPVKS